MRFGGKKHSQEELKARWQKQHISFLREVCRNKLHPMSEQNVFYMIHGNSVIRSCHTCKLESNKRARHKYNEKTQNKEKHNSYQKSLVKKYRDIVLDAYGAKCACCGETRRRFLTIEHLNGDGHKHRKALKHRVYFDIYKQNFPKDKYAILCMNCNFARGRGKQCPHDIEREASRTAYPGQEFFRSVNPDIRRAEENWEIAHGLRKAA